MSLSLTLEQAYLEGLNPVEKKKHLLKVRIIKYLYTKGSKSNADICQRLKISSPTSLGLINELIAEGLVEKQGRGKSVGGRRPDLYGLKENSLFVLGIEMGRFKTRMAIFDSNSNSISEIEDFPIQLSKDLSAVEQLYESAQQLLISSKLDIDKLVGIGISMPGLVVSKEGNSYTYLLTESETTSLQHLLELKFNKPVFIQNDVKSATLAEYRFGLAYGRRDVLVISMDWGVGVGIIMDGKLRSGTSGFSGEFGHIPLVDDGMLCHCGKRGCLETVASGNALTQMARDGVKAGQSSLLSVLPQQQIDTESIIDAANKGDQYAISILSEVGMKLGKGISILIQLFNPELIILGGKIAEAKQYITVPIQHSINTYCMTQLRETTSIALSQLGQNAGIMGSVATVMEHIFENFLESER